MKREINLVKRIGKIEGKPKGAVKLWRSQPGHFDSAARAAHHYAVKAGRPILVVPGNSYMSRVYHLIDQGAGGDIRSVTVANPAGLTVGVVHPDGAVDQGVVA